MENGDAQEGNRKGKAKTDYSNWSIEESKMLLQLMVDATSRGWRDANGLLSKAIVETRILPVLNQKLGCKKTHNNYTSRLKFFKREHQKYYQLLKHNSGFGWDATTKKFTAPEEVWEDYFQSHPTHRSLRNKTCDDYEDLQIVIGNATATGKNSLRLGDETDARIFGVEDRHTALDDFVYDEANEAFVPYQNEPSPLGGSSSPLPFQATSSEVPPIRTTCSKKRTRTESEGNSFETNNQVWIMEKISLSIDSIAADFRGVHNLLEKREKDRERQSCIWDAIKETPNLEERARYKALALLTNNTKKEAFLKMSLEEHFLGLDHLQFGMSGYFDHDTSCFIGNFFCVSTFWFTAFG